MMAGGDMAGGWGRVAASVIDWDVHDGCLVLKLEL
jgi:hypothetical protein